MERHVLPPLGGESCYEMKKGQDRTKADRRATNATDRRPTRLEEMLVSERPSFSNLILESFDNPCMAVWEHDTPNYPTPK